MKYEIIKENIQLTFFLDKASFYYSEPAREENAYYNTDGIIPQRILDKGEDAIFNYILKKIKKAKKGWQKGESIEDKIKEEHIPISTEYKDGTILEGRIIEATSRCIQVELDNPLKGKSCINYGFASAMARHYVFTEEHEISKNGNESAKRALCWAYEDAIKADKKDLIKKINNKLKE